MRRRQDWAGVTDTGVKSWALWLKDVGRGRYRLKTLGHYPAISLAKACAEARRLSSAAENGEALFGAPRRQPTFADLSEDYLKRHARPEKRSADEDERKIKIDLLPEFGSRLASDLTKADIVRAVDRIADRGAGIAANRTLALLRKLYNWAMAEGLVEANPAAGIPMRAKEQSRERVLDDGEIASFWSALGVSGFDAATADVLRLQLLLGARIREVTDLHVSELDFAGAEAVWRLPRERAKSGRGIVRPLPPLAVAIIKRRLHDDAFVFASRTNPGRPMTPRAGTCGTARGSKGSAAVWLHAPRFAPHGGDKACSTRVEEAVCKRILGHAPQRSDMLEVCTTVTPIYPRCGARWKNSNSMCWRLSIARRLRKLCVFVEQMVRVMKSIADFRTTLHAPH